MQIISYRRWSPPGSPLRIEFPADLPRQIRAQAVSRDARGLLYGLRQGPEARILADRVWPDDSSALAPELEQDSQAALLDAIGIFVYRSRGEVFLTEGDLRLFEKRKAQLALVAVGDRAGFFVKESDGSFRTLRSYVVCTS